MKNREALTLFSSIKLNVKQNGQCCLLFSGKESISGGLLCKILDISRIMYQIEANIVTIF